MLLLFERFFYLPMVGRSTCWSFVPPRLAAWWIGNDSPTETSSFYRIGKVLTEKWYAAVIVIFIITLFCGAFSYPAFTFTTYISDSFQLALPRGDPFTDAVLAMQHDFGDGFLNSFRILVVPPSGTDLMADSSFFAAMDQVREKVLSVGNITCSNIASPFYSFCSPIRLLFFFCSSLFLFYDSSCVLVFFLILSLCVSPLLYKTCALIPSVSAQCPDLLRLQKMTIRFSLCLFFFFFFSWIKKKKKKWWWCNG